MRRFVAGAAFIAGACFVLPANAQESPVFAFWQMDRLEYVEQEEDWIWDTQGWVGGDAHKFWWKSEGEFDGDDAEVQLLYSKAISPYWDVQIGLRNTLEPEPAEFSAVIGLQGLAPQWFEVDLAAFVTEDGELEARLEIEYDLLLTQRLILQPRLELDSQEEMTSLDLRLRYEFHRKLAPYVGVSWADAQGQRGETSLVAGARFWF